MFSHDRCFIVGEVAGAHDGSFMFARAHIDAVAEAGCDAVKFQIHLAEAESTPDEAFRVPIPGYRTRTEYWQKTSFREDQWHDLAQYARERGLIFMASAFSMAGVDLLERLQAPVHKVPSGEVGNLPLLDRLAATGKPVILSTGLSGFAEIDAAMARLAGKTGAIAITQCVTQYPTPASRIGLNVLPVLRQRYGCFAGLSDHSGTVFPGIAGAYAGMDVLEVHARLGPNMPGPDARASLDPPMLKLLVDGVRFAEEMRRHPVDKEAIAVELAPLRSLFAQAIYTRRPIASGEIITDAMLECRKPMAGIPANRWYDVVGRAAARSIEANRFLQDADLKP
jgi:N-acetylneuraminate synthase